MIYNNTVEEYVNPVKSNFMKPLVTFIIAFIFSMLLCYIDEDTKSFSALFSTEMFLVSFLYACFAFLVIIGANLRIKDAEWRYMALLGAAVIYSILIALVGSKYGHVGYVVFFSILFFIYLALINLTTDGIIKLLQYRRKKTT
jgi:hypothetical protein